MGRKRSSFSLFARSLVDYIKYGYRGDGDDERAKWKKNFRIAILCVWMHLSSHSLTIPDNGGGGGGGNISYDGRQNKTKQTKKKNEPESIYI